MPTLRTRTFDPKAVTPCHEELGLNRPIIVHFLEFRWGFAHSLGADQFRRDLHLGVQEPVPAWGLMLQGGAEE